MLVDYRSIKVTPWALLLGVAIIVASFFATVERLQTPPGAAVPPELAKVWEVYQTVKADYAGVEPVEMARLTDGAVKGMVSAMEREKGTLLPPGSYDSRAPDLEGVWQAWEIIEGELDGTGSGVTADELEDAAIQGMLAGLGNPHTAYMDADRFALEESSLESSFEGIGAYVDLVGPYLTVTDIISGTPAKASGLQAGDVILEADDQPLQGMSITEAVLLIRGAEGTDVTLLIRRPSEDEPRHVTITRGVVEEPSVNWAPVDGSPQIAHIEIREFLDNTDDRLRDALGEILAGDIRGVIVDVRRNPGGLLTATVGVVSQFLGEGLVLYHVDSSGNRKEFPVREGGMALEIPLVVLGDSFSASGSEVLIGALQDHGRATVIGTRTFGKGSVNELRKLEDGSGLYLTSALWYTPDGRLIEGEGLEPDIVVENEQVIRWDGQALRLDTVDRQLPAAVDFLERKLS